VNQRMKGVATRAVVGGGGGEIYMPVKVLNRSKYEERNEKGIAA
jgi:hypothetical protein